MRTFVFIIILSIVTNSFGSALSKPCETIRSVRVTAGAAAASTALSITIASHSPTVMTPQTISVRNENTTAGDDAYINIEGTAVASDASPPTANVRVSAMETISFDVRPGTPPPTVSYIRAGANNVTLKFVIGY